MSSISGDPGHADRLLPVCSALLSLSVLKLSPKQPAVGKIDLAFQVTGHSVGKLRQVLKSGA